MFNGILNGLGKDTPTVVNEKGAKQSGIPYRADLFPPKAFLAISNVLHTGAVKYGEKNWLGLSVAEHLNHLLTHIMAYQAGDRQDDHLGHMACRAVMALERALLDRSYTDAEKSVPSGTHQQGRPGQEHRPGFVSIS